MPISKEQIPTTIDKQHHQRYKTLSNASGGRQMAALRRSAYNFLSTFDVRRRILAKYRRQGICLSEVELIENRFMQNFIVMIRL